MMPAAVQELFGRISELSQPPAAVAQFAEAFSQRAAAQTAATADQTATASAPSATGATATPADTASVAAQRSVTAAVSGSLTGKRAALPAAAAPWTSAIRSAATKAGIDPDLLTSLVWVESSFQPDAVSPAGAVGLAQLMPGTAKGLGVDPTNPAQNLDGAARMLHGLIEQFGRVDLALAAYNVGPNALTRGLAQGQTPGRGYAEAVATKYRTITGRELFA